MKEISIYIHIPFCIRKCNYCDFLSAPANEQTQNLYLQSLLKEIEDAGRLQKQEELLVKTVFIGGGTPTAVASSFIRETLCKLSETFPLDQETEITIECNPGTVNPEKLLEYRRAGVNRLSIGLQSANDSELLRLGRIHTYEQFLKTYEQARQAGFSNINIDLMSSLPEQTLLSFQHTLQTVVSLGPEHISVYSLIVEEGTPFYREQNTLNLPDEDTEMQIYRYTREYLASKNYTRYEISNYAKEGCSCAHNKVYWERGSYLGFGIGAASLVEFGEGRNYRYSNVRRMDDYIEIMSTARSENKYSDLSYSRAIDTTSVECLTEKCRMEEFMFLGLRETAGVRDSCFREMFGRSLDDVYNNILCKLERAKLLQRMKEKEDTRIYLTERGMDVSNVVLAEFLL